MGLLISWEEGVPHPIFCEVAVNARFVSSRAKKFEKMQTSDVEKKGVRKFTNAVSCKVSEEAANEGLSSEKHGAEEKWGGRLSARRGRLAVNTWYSSPIVTESQGKSVNPRRIKFKIRTLEFEGCGPRRYSALGAKPLSANFSTTLKCIHLPNRWRCWLAKLMENNAARGLSFLLWSG
jgi:hypothetical protein